MLMQVSVDTMNAVYAAPSLRGPAAQLAFKLHNTADNNFREQKQQPKRQKVEEPAAEVSSNQQMFHQLQQLMQQQHEKHMASIQSINHKPIDVLPAVETAKSVTSERQPYGRALNAQRLKHRDSIQRYLVSLGMCTNDKPPPAEFVKSVFQELCKHRSANKLPAEAEWFARDVTYFTDDNEVPFKNFIRKLWTRSTL